MGQTFRKMTTHQVFDNLKIKDADERKQVTENQSTKSNLLHLELTNNK